MKPTISIAMLLLSITTVNAQDYDPRIDELMNQTNLDSLVSFVRILSGEDSVSIGDSTVLIEHRVNEWSNDLAADYIKQTLENYGLETYDQSYDDDGRNIYAIQPGSFDSTKQFIICAHYDAVDFHGADDDASGTAAVLEAARILSDHLFNYTIIYAFWDEEETGPYGSGYFASQADIHATDIRGVLNLDMVGWDGNDDNVIEIHAGDVANSDYLANLLVGIDLVYSLPLEPVVYNPGTPYSDHASFWDMGYGAILLIEGYWADDLNPYWHSSQDRIDKFDLPYFHDIAKLAIGSISYLADDTTNVFWDIIPIGRISTADFINGDTGWIAGDGTLLKTDDGGQIWNSLSIRTNWDIQLIDFIDDSIGWAIEQDYTNGRILKTRDGGQSWLIQEVFTDNYSILSLDVVSDSVAYTAGIITQTPYPCGRIMKTMDGGLSWAEVTPSNDSTDLSSVSFVNSDMGVAAGYSSSYGGIILRTFNGGDTWDKTAVPIFTRIDDLQFVNDSTLYFLADDQYLYKSKDTLNSWTVKTDSVTSYYALDNNAVYAIKEGNIMKSADGGISWAEQYSGYDDLILVEFVDYSTGWVVGSNGTVLATTDGGDSWIDRSVSITPLEVDDILTHKLPQGFELSQNYPNPFNSSTTIQFDLPAATEVVLVVYDLLGREMARLAQGVQAAGYHQTQWNGRGHLGRDVPSGIYIARLVTPEYTKSIKMTLLK